MPCHGPVTIRRICSAIVVAGVNPSHFAGLGDVRMCPMSGSYVPIFLSYLRIYLHAANSGLDDGQFCFVVRIEACPADLGWVTAPPTVRVAASHF